MFSFKSHIRYSEVNESGQLDLSSVINYLQDCSMMHSQSAGLGIDYFKEHKRAWILNSWQIDLLHLPLLFDEIKISTYPYYVKGYSGRRNFTITSKTDDIYIYADSSWIYLDGTTGRPIHTTSEESIPYGICKKLNMEYITGKIQIPNNMEAKTPVKIEPTYIDTNHHVNNAQYVRLAQNYLKKTFKTSRLRVEYRKAAKIGDHLYPYICQEGDRFLVVFNNDSLKPYAVIEFSNIGGYYATNR